LQIERETIGKFIDASQVEIVKKMSFAVIALLLLMELVSSFVSNYMTTTLMYAASCAQLKSIPTARSSIAV